MEEVPGGVSGSRRNEDIALDLMKFVAMTTGYGRTIRQESGSRAQGRPPSRKSMPDICWSSTASACRRLPARSKQWTYTSVGRTLPPTPLRAGFVRRR